MIKSLRRRHLQVWTLLAVLLPAGIIAGAIMIPKFADDKLLQSTSISALPVLVKTIETNDFTVSLRSDSSNISRQLEWNNKSVIVTPSALIYQVPGPGDDIMNALLIGRIEGKGIFRFSIKNNTGNNKAYHFVLYDIIHHRKVTDVNF